MTAVAIGLTALAATYIIVKAWKLRVPVDASDDLDWESNEGWGGLS